MIGDLGGIGFDSVLSCIKCQTELQPNTQTSTRFYVSERCDHIICNKCLDELYPQRGQDDYKYHNNLKYGIGHTQKQKHAINTEGKDFIKCVKNACMTLLSRKDFIPYKSLEEQVQNEV